MAPILELVEIANLENWISDHGGNIGKYPTTSIEEYEKAVRELTTKIRSEKIISDVENALKEMYSVRRYYPAPVLMSRTKFNRIVGEFAAGNLENLEKFELFLITTARLTHLKAMKNDYTNLSRWYRELKKSNDELTLFKIITLLSHRGIPLELFMLYNLHANPRELKKRIYLATTMQQNAERDYLKLLVNIKLTPISNVMHIDRHFYLN